LQSLASGTDLPKLHGSVVNLSGFHGPRPNDLQDIDYARPVVFVELDEEIPGIATLLARTFNKELNGIDIEAVLRSDHSCDLSGKADRWISFRTKKSDLALFPGVCCISCHRKHIAAELKAPNINVHFLV